MYEDHPGLPAVVGPRRFDGLVRAYLAEYPSRSFALQELSPGPAAVFDRQPQVVAAAAGDGRGIARFGAGPRRSPFVRRRVAGGNPRRPARPTPAELSSASSRASRCWRCGTRWTSSARWSGGRCCGPRRATRWRASGPTPPARPMRGRPPRRRRNGRTSGSPSTGTTTRCTTSGWRRRRFSFWPACGTARRSRRRSPAGCRPSSTRLRARAQGVVRVLDRNGMVRQDVRARRLAKAVANATSGTT